jgi:RNA polymerase sigma-70 factor, ECF subfamily
MQALRRWQDRQAVRRIRRGDRLAAEQLADDQYESAYHWLLHLCGDPERAADLTQETFAQVWDDLDQYRGTASLRTWVHRIAYHTYLRAERTRRAEAAPRQGPADVPGPDISQAALTRLQVREALGRLPERQQHAVVLHYWQGLSVAEIARVEDVPIGTVLSRLHTARARLRELLSEKPITHAQEVETNVAHD